MNTGSSHFGKFIPRSSLSFSFQLQEVFGWEPFINLFAEYQTIVHIPKDNESKMNLWLKLFSEKVQKNLVPFFEAWGWPIQKAVAEALACFPSWQDHPLKMYIGME